MIPRSPHWPAVEKAHLADQPGCAVCGKTDSVNVHHCFPFEVGRHLGYPSTELWPDDLITLCETEHLKPENNHHLLVGHGGDFECTNLNVREDVIRYKNMTHDQIMVTDSYKELVKDRLPRPDLMTDEQKAYCIQWLKDHYPNLPEFQK